jgi:hypothetical protein
MAIAKTKTTPSTGKGNSNCNVILYQVITCYVIFHTDSLVTQLECSNKKFSGYKKQLQHVHRTEYQTFQKQITIRQLKRHNSKCYCNDVHCEDIKSNFVTMYADGHRQPREH